MLATWQRPIDTAAPAHGGPLPQRLAGRLLGQVDRSRWATHQGMRGFRSDLAVTGSDPTLFVSRTIVGAGAFAFVPVVCWLVLVAVGLTVPLGAAVLVSVVGVPVAIALAAGSLRRTATARRRHFRVVIGSFVDLVVLSLAGGVGIDGALHDAAQVTADWAAQRMSKALLAARDGGVAPWAALSALGAELGVPELVELSTTVQLAGTEGARVRQSLTARGASLRRHEQADAESAANAMTERLFLPGALLLIGFLVFIGFPAVHRILGGF